MEHRDSWKGILIHLSHLDLVSLSVTNHFFHLLLQNEDLLRSISKHFCAIIMHDQYLFWKFIRKEDIPIILLYDAVNVYRKLGITGYGLQTTYDCPDIVSYDIKCCEINI